MKYRYPKILLFSTHIQYFTFVQITIKKPKYRGNLQVYSLQQVLGILGQKNKNAHMLIDTEVNGMQELQCYYLKYANKTEIIIKLQLLVTSRIGSTMICDITTVVVQLFIFSCIYCDRWYRTSTLPVYNVYIHHCTWGVPCVCL